MCYNNHIIAFTVTIAWDIWGTNKQCLLYSNLDSCEYKISPIGPQILKLLFTLLLPLNIYIISQYNYHNTSSGDQYMYCICILAISFHLDKQ